MVKEAKAAAQDVNRNNYSSTAKSATKEILKETAQMIADLAQTKLPALPALALKAEWKDTVGTRNVISDYSIAATAYKPVDFFWGQGIVNEGSSISLDRLDNAVARVVNKIKAVLNNKIDFSKLNFSKISYDASGFKVNEKVTLWYKTTDVGGGTYVVSEVRISSNDTEAGFTNGGTFTVTKDFKDNIDAMIAAVNAGVPFDYINDLVAELQSTINSANSYADRALNLEKRVSNYLESYINRIITSLSNQGLYKVLQPILLFEGENGVNRMVSGATLKAGKVTLLPTSVTNELLAPAFKKYIAVNGKGEILTNGDKNFKKYEITLEKGENKIVYAALDFYGNQVVKTYTVNAE